jgi:anti-sigma B factor antagonist
MSTRIENNNGVTIIHLSSEIDLDSSPTVRNQIKENLESSSSVHVDLGKVNYIDSSGIASLIDGMQTSKKLKKEFALVNVSNEVMKVIKLARLDKIFKILSVTNQNAAEQVTSQPSATHSQSTSSDHMDFKPDIKSSSSNNDDRPAIKREDSSDDKIKFSR